MSFEVASSDMQGSDSLLFESLAAIAAAISHPYSLQEFLHFALHRMRQATISDAGSIYLIDRNGSMPAIAFEVSQTDSQPERSLVEFAVPLSDRTLVGYVAITGETLNVPDAQKLPADAPYSHHKTFDADIDYCTRSVLALPLKGAAGNTIGVLQLINRKIDGAAVIANCEAENFTQPYSQREERFATAAAAIVAAVIERDRQPRGKG